jgi:S-DNA-T family DNA segregation ATPase FtsK/SpoIIIE
LIPVSESAAVYPEILPGLVSEPAGPEPDLFGPEPSEPGASSSEPSEPELSRPVGSEPALFAESPVSPASESVSEAFAFSEAPASSKASAFSGAADSSPAPSPPLSERARPAEEGGLASAVQEELPEVELPEDMDLAGQRFRAGLFPPPLDIFGPSAKIDEEDGSFALAGRQAEVIVKTLQDFGVKSNVAHIVIGPSVIQFQLELAPGIKVSKVSGLANDLTMALAVVSVRVEAPILGQRYVGIEIPNPRRKGITLRSLMESEEFQGGEFTLPLPMGVRVDSKHLVCGLEDMPHLLVAGTTGSGKSVFTNTCILGMCSQRSPGELKLILVDPKHVEFAIYEGLPHLLARPVSDPKKAIAALTWAVQEMEVRSEAFAKAKVRNLASYNEKVLPKSRFPHIVVVVDELADLMYTAGKEVENLIARLAQKARAAGIHLILATQRPSVDVITGLIKANVPARVAFAVPSQTDSRTIIDTGGAEKLLGKGDMLFYSARYPRPLRLQASFITEERTLEFVGYMKNVFGEPEYIEFEDLPNGGNGEDRAGPNSADDPKLAEAVRIVMNTGIASASGLQRHLNIGYPRAGRLISGLELLGIVGPQSANSSKPREILMDEDTALDVIERARSGDSFEEF